MLRSHKDQNKRCTGQLRSNRNEKTIARLQHLDSSSFRPRFGFCLGIASFLQHPRNRQEDSRVEDVLPAAVPLAAHAARAHDLRAPLLDQPLRSPAPGRGSIPVVTEPSYELQWVLRRRRRFRFSLLALLGLTAMVAVIASYGRVIGGRDFLRLVVAVLAAIYLFAPLVVTLILAALPRMDEGRLAMAVVAVGVSLLLGALALGLSGAVDDAEVVVGFACCSTVFWAIQGVCLAAAFRAAKFRKSPPPRLAERWARPAQMPPPEQGDCRANSRVPEDTGGEGPPCGTRGP